MQEIICKKKLKIYLNEICKIKSANAIISKIIYNQKKKKKKENLSNSINRKK